MEFFNPQSSPFTKSDNIEFYKTWNGEALINFKWRKYGRYYYLGIWLLYTIFLLCFLITTTKKPFEDIFLMGEKKEIEEPVSGFLIITIVLGCFHLLFEVREFILNPLK